ncbi:MAG: 3-oxoacyl-[acyl-carrier-protein] reductase [Bacillota bacterium]
MVLGGKAAIVTGGSRGIGRATALALAREGASVLVNYAGNVAAAESVAREIRSLGGEAFTFQADVSVHGEAQGLISAAIERFGKIDILINNAGITRDNLLLRMREEDWDNVMDTNLKSVYNCCKAVLKPMIKQRDGRIINISSVVGLIGNAGQANYAAAKAGVIGLTKSMAKELASRGILVNAVAPGFIETDMTRALGEGAHEELITQVPLQRIGSPEDVAAVVVFLASPSAGYITGQVINVDGGMVM